MWLSVPALSTGVDVSQSPRRVNGARCTIDESLGAATQAAPHLKRLQSTSSLAAPSMDAFVMRLHVGTA